MLIIKYDQYLEYKLHSTRYSYRCVISFFRHTINYYPRMSFRWYSRLPQSSNIETILCAR